jgi:hypothetical protein
MNEWNLTTKCVQNYDQCFDLDCIKLKNKTKRKFDISCNEILKIKIKSKLESIQK